MHRRLVHSWRRKSRLRGQPQVRASDSLSSLIMPMNIGSPPGRGPHLQTTQRLHKAAMLNKHPRIGIPPDTSTSTKSEPLHPLPQCPDPCPHPRMNCTPGNCSVESEREAILKETSRRITN